MNIRFRSFRFVSFAIPVVSISDGAAPCRVFLHFPRCCSPSFLPMPFPIENDPHLLHFLIALLSIDFWLRQWGGSPGPAGLLFFLVWRGCQGCNGRPLGRSAHRTRGGDPVFSGALGDGKQTNFPIRAPASVPTQGQQLVARLLSQLEGNPSEGSGEKPFSVPD